MKRIISDPRKLILWHHLGTGSELCDLVKDKIWLNKHPIPVFYAPKELLEFGEFILNDGHKRAVATMRNGMQEVPLLILETTEDISQVNGELSRPFEEIYNNVLGIVKRKYSDKSMYARLREVRTRGYNP